MNDHRKRIFLLIKQFQRKTKDNIYLIANFQVEILYIYGSIYAEAGMLQRGRYSLYL